MWRFCLIVTDIAAVAAAVAMLALYARNRNAEKGFRWCKRAETERQRKGKKIRLAEVHKKKEGFDSRVYFLRFSSFTNGGSAVRTQQTRQKQEHNNNPVEGRGVRGWGLRMGGLHSVSRINKIRIVPNCRRFDCIRCSVRSLVMPHSATIIARGDEISTTISWNSGVLVSHSCIRRYTL